MADDNTTVELLVIDSSGALDGARQFEEAADQIAAASDAAAASSDKLSGAIDRTTTTVSTSARVLNQQKTALDSVAASIAPVYNATQQLERASSSTTQAEAGLTAQMMAGKISVSEYEAAAAALQGRRSQLQATTKQLQSGEISVKQATDVAAQSLTLSGGAAAGAAAGYKLTYTEAEILRSGAVNVAQSLAAGMSPLQTLQTQLFQTAPAFGGLAKSIGLALPLLAALAVAAVVVAGALIGGAVAAISYADSQKVLQQALSSSGGVVGVTVDKLNDYAAAAADAAHISVSSARDIEAAYVSTGKVGAQNIEPLIELTANLAHVTGEDLAKAQKTVADAIQDPLKAAKDLTEQTGALSAAQIDEIRNLQEQGDKYQALSKFTQDANQHLKELTDAGLAPELSIWQQIGHAISDATDKLGQYIAKKAGLVPQTPQDKLTGLQQELASAQSGFGQLSGIGSAGIPVFSPSRSVADIQHDIDAINADTAAHNALAAAQAKTADDHKLSADADDLARSINTEATSYEELTGHLTQLQNLQAKGIPLTAGQQAALEKLTHAHDTYLTTDQRAAAQAQIDIQVAGAQAGSRDALRAKLQAELDTKGKLITTDQAAHDVANAVTQATAGQTAAIVDQTDALALQGAASVKSAQAYLQGSVQGVQADAERQASLEKLANAQVNLNQATQQALEDYVSKQLDAGSKTVISIDDQVAAQQNLLDASTKGIAAEHDAEVQNQITAATRDLITAKTIALTAATNAQTAADKQLYLQQAQSLQQQIDASAQGIRTNDVDAQNTSLNLDIGAEQQKLDLLQKQAAAGVTLTGQQSDSVIFAQKELQLRQQLPGADQAHIDQLAQMSVDEAHINEQIKASQQLWSDIGNLIQNTFQSTFENIFEHGLKGFKDFGQTIQTLFAQIASKMVTDFVFKPGVDMSSLTGSGSPFSGGSGVLSSDSWLDKLFGNTSSAGTTAAFDFNNQTATSNYGQALSGLSQGQIVGGGLFGNGGALGTGLSGGSLLGAGLGVVGVASQAASGQLDPGTGALEGAVIGTTIAPGIGTVVGAAIGAIAGWLSSQPKQHHDALTTYAVDRETPGGLGRVGITDATSDHQDNGDNTKRVAMLVKSINSFADRFGLDISTKGQKLGVSVGDDRNEDYQASAKLSLRKFLAGHDFSSDDKVVNYALQHNSDHNLEDLRATILAAEKGAAELNKTLGQTGHATSEVQNQMSALRQEFVQDTANAQKYGQTQGTVRQAFARQFNTSVGDQLQQINHPEAAALAQASRDATARLNVAKALGANLVQVEKLNAADRLAVVEQYAGITLDQLKTNLALSGHTVDDAQSQIATLTQTLDSELKLINQANNPGGIKAGQVIGAARGQLNTSIADSLLEINNPEQAALQQLQRDDAARLAYARKVGGDINEVEKYNAALRLQIVQQYNQAANDNTKLTTEQLAQQARSLLTTTSSNIDDFVKSLQTGNLSALTPEQQFAQTKHQYDIDAKAAANGNVAASGRLEADITAYLTAAQQRFGSGQRYTDIFNQTLQALNHANNALGTDHAFKNAEWIVKSQNQGTKELQKTFREELALTRKDLRELINVTKKGQARPKAKAA